MKVSIIRSDRRSISIRVNEDMSVTVRAPVYVGNSEIERILRRKEPWIRKQTEQLRERTERQKNGGIRQLTGEDLRQLSDKARRIIPERAAYYAELIGVDYGRITIRRQKTRWGSCSSSGNLNFNCLLMLAPAEVIDYVVVHELCHRKEMNHSPAFWNEVKKVLPDYREHVSWLKNEGRDIITFGRQMQ